MIEENLIEKALGIINKNYSNIYVIDIMGDMVYKLDFNSENKLNIVNNVTYTDFIDLANKFIFKDDLSYYFEHISLNNLETEMSKGNSETKFKYRKIYETGECRWCLNVINLIEIDGKKMIFMMTEDVNERLTDSEMKNDELENKIVDYQNKMNSDNESISNAILQINNMLDSSGNDNMKINSTKDYINSVFNKVSVNNPDLNKAIINTQLISNNYKKKTILIVDDSSIIRTSLKRIFSDEFDIVMAKDGEEAVQLIESNIINSVMREDTLNIVGVLLDLMMPIKDGFYVLDYMQKFNLMNRIPVAIISGDETKETRKRVYQYDIVDMLEKPFNTDMIRKRISKIINLHIAEYNLMNIVNKQSENINGNDKIKFVFEKIVNNVLNKNESIKLKHIVRLLCLNINGLDNKLIDAIVNICPLYNIGAIAIDENTVITIKTIKESIDYGLTIVETLYEDNYETNVLKTIIKYSLELYNGKGYPNGIKGDDIPIEAQIVNLAVRICNTDLNKINATVKKINNEESEKYNPILLNSLELCKKEIKNIK